MDEQEPFPSPPLDHLPAWRAPGREPFNGAAPRPVIDRPLVSPTWPRHGGSILMAAMIGLANALGLDPEPTEMVQPADANDGPELDLHFGNLPPLN